MAQAGLVRPAWPRLEDPMSAPAAVHSNWASLVHPNGDPIRLNHRDFLAIDRDGDATYDPIYRPQALYNRVINGFHANNEAFLLQEVATNLPIYRPMQGRPISISICPRAASSSCWSPRASSPSITTG